MADMTQSKWNTGKNYNQCPLKSAGFSLKGTINTIDKQTLDA